MGGGAADAGRARSTASPAGTTCLATHRAPARVSLDDTWRFLPVRLVAGPLDARPRRHSLPTESENRARTVTQPERRRQSRQVTPAASISAHGRSAMRLLIATGSKPSAACEIEKGDRMVALLRLGGTPRRIRTPNLLIRSQMLYPVELWAHQNCQAARSNKPRHQSVAEREGFEPSVSVTLHTLSRRAPSATRSPLRNLAEGEGFEPPWAFTRRFSRPLPYQLGLALPNSGRRAGAKRRADAYGYAVAFPPSQTRRHAGQGRVRNGKARYYLAFRLSRIALSPFAGPEVPAPAPLAMV